MRPTSLDPWLFGAAAAGAAAGAAFVTAVCGRGSTGLDDGDNGSTGIETAGPDSTLTGSGADLSHQHRIQSRAAEIRVMVAIIVQDQITDKFVLGKGSHPEGPLAKTDSARLLETFR